MAQYLESGCPVGDQVFTRLIMLSECSDPVGAKSLSQTKAKKRLCKASFLKSFKNSNYKGKVSFTFLFP